LERSLLSLALAAAFLAQPADLSLLAPGGRAARLLAPPLPAVEASALRCRRCSVVLVSIDTLRADHLGLYGYPLPTSPAIDRLGADAIVFREAIVTAPSTLPSHASLFTGLLTSQHQAETGTRTPLPTSVTTLAEVLSGVGFATAAFTGHGQLDPTFGLDQGFTVYENRAQRSLQEAVDDGLAWVDGLDDERFFLFLHTYDVHAPYQPSDEALQRLGPPPDSDLPVVVQQRLIDLLNGGMFGLQAFGPGDAAHVARSYDGEIVEVDAAVGDLVQGLEDGGLLDRVVLVVTADHGEEFGEHGNVGMHAHSLYDEVLRVPLVVRLPGAALAGTTVAPQVRSIDVAPTLLDLVGVEFDMGATGSSLLPLLAGDERHGRVALASRLRDTGRTFALRTQRWKLLEGRLFDLGRDPGETVDVADRHPLAVQALSAALADLLALPAVEGAGPVELTDALRERLRALGYLR